MDRRHFLGTGLVTLAGATSDLSLPKRAASAESGSDTASSLCAPSEVTLNVKPVLTTLIHTDSWEGPCRWSRVSVDDEKRNAQETFLRWPEQLRAGALGRAPRVRVLEPVQIVFKEDFVVPESELAKLAADSQATDVYFLAPHGSSVSAYRVAERFRKPILMKGLGCRNVDIAAYTQAKGYEAVVAADDDDLVVWLNALRARKMFQQTRVLFPTNQGLPASCSVGSIWDLDDLKQRLGVGVATIGLPELAGEMDAILADKSAVEQAHREADDLSRRAQKSFIKVEYVAQSFLFRRAVENLMRRHGCNAFTIECFEFCSSRLPERWQITPCLIHSLFRNAEMASSCEGDLGSLLAMRLLMSVSGKSCHQGNSDPRTADAFSINHSVPSMKMNGFDQPDVSFQLGRFVQSGWGTKVVVDFMRNEEKAVTVARVNPQATKLLVLRGELSGSNGWDQDLIGCSVTAVINPPRGRTNEFLRKRLEYGNHLQWVYGDHTVQLQRAAELLKLGVDVIS